MPRGRTAAIAKLDPLEEIRQMRARQAALRGELAAKRDRLLAEVAEIDEALAEMGGAAPARVLVPNPAPAEAITKAETPRARAAKQASGAPSAGSPQGRADKLLAELRELAPWRDVLPPTARQVFDLRVSGLSTAEAAHKLGKTVEQAHAAVQYAKKALREARTKGKPGETPASDDEGEPAPAATPAPTNDNAEPRAPTGWDRSDPDADFTDLDTATPKADPAHVHLWSPESGGVPACTMWFDAAARTTTDRAEASCPTCLAIPEPAAPAGAEQRPPEWALAWLPPEVRRAYQGVALEGLSCQTMAWTEAVSANVVSGRVNGARRRIRRLLAWEAERAAEGHPLTDRDREPPARQPGPGSVVGDPAAPRGRAATPPAPPAPDLVRIRARTSSAARLSRAERRAGAELDYPDIERPRTRGDCQDAPRPCPFVSCSHHLYLDANPETGALKLNFPHLEVEGLPETCVLDVADKGGITLEEVGAILNLTRERIRQIEVAGCRRCRTGTTRMRRSRAGRRWAARSAGSDRHRPAHQSQNRLTHERRGRDPDPQRLTLDVRPFLVGESDRPNLGHPSWWFATALALCGGHGADRNSASADC